jgi:hypothetical protein
MIFEEKSLDRTTFYVWNGEPGAVGGKPLYTRAMSTSPPSSYQQLPGEAARRGGHDCTIRPGTSSPFHGHTVEIRWSIQQHIIIVIFYSLHP